MTLKNPPDPPVLSPDAQSLYLGFSYLHLGRRVKCKWACAQPRVRPLHSLVKIFVQPAHFPDWAKDIGVRHVIQHRNLCATLNLPLSSLPCSSPALSCELLNPVCLPHPSTSLDLTVILLVLTIQTVITTLQKHPVRYLYPHLALHPYILLSLPQVAVITELIYYHCSVYNHFKFIVKYN